MLHLNGPKKCRQHIFASKRGCSELAKITKSKYTDYCVSQQFVCVRGTRAEWYLHTLWNRFSAVRMARIIFFYMPRARCCSWSISYESVGKRKAKQIFFMQTVVDVNQCDDSEIASKANVWCEGNRIALSRWGHSTISINSRRNDKWPPSLNFVIRVNLILCVDFRIYHEPVDPMIDNKQLFLPICVWALEHDRIT